MLRLIRGLVRIDAEDSTDPDRFWGNYHSLFGANSVKFTDSYATIVEYIQEYLIKYNKEFPTVSALADHFSGNSTVEYMLKELGDIPFRFGSEFQQLIDIVRSEQLLEKFESVCVDAGTIATKGKKVNKEFKQGVKDAFSFIIKHIDDFSQPEIGTKVRGDIREDIEIEKQNYYNKKLNPSLSFGMLTGIDDIDSVTYGLKKGELMTVAAYSGQGKTTFCLNYAYYAAVYLGYNVVYYSLEMPYQQVRSIFYCLHTCYKDFRGIHAPIPYDRIKNVKLTPEEEEFYFGVVLPDFAKKVKITNGSDETTRDTEDAYGTIRVIQPVGDITPQSLRSELEAMNQVESVDLVFIDYPNLMQPDSYFNQRREGLNSIIKSVKQMAMTFNNGQGVPVVIPFQINNEGYEEAKKNGGFYSPDHIAETSEIFKSSDLIITIYNDEAFREVNQARVCCLKHRDGELFKPFYIHTNLKSRYMGKQPDERVDFSLQSFIDAGFRGLED